MSRDYTKKKYLRYSEFECFRVDQLPFLFFLQTFCQQNRLYANLLNTGGIQALIENQFGSIQLKLQTFLRLLIIVYHINKINKCLAFG